MKYKITGLLFGCYALLVLQSCGHKQAGPDPARFTNDSAAVVVDESLQPVVDQELYIFKSLDPKMHPRVIYAPENDAINLLLADSVRIALTSRDLTPAEYKVLNEHNLHPVVGRFAVDAIAIIVNKTSNDTTITISELKKMLNGQDTQGKNIIFDNPNSGLVRYLKDFSGNKDLKQKNIFSLKSNKEVIEYVSKHSDAIGITGFSWLDDPDSDYKNAVDNVKIVAVKDEDNKEYATQYFKPSQTSLSLKQYPLSRSLFIVNCTDRMGLGTGFANFMTSDRGQRIIMESGLLPDNIPEREITIKKSFN